MGYIDNYLMNGEQVIYRARLHNIVYTPPILALLCFSVVCICFPAIETLALFFVVAAICLGWAVRIYGGRQFVLTSKRVIVKEGIIKRKSNELMLRKCESIQVAQSIMGRLFNYGTVFVTTGEATNQYDMIKSPIIFSTKINEQIDMLNKTKSLVSR